MAPDCLPHQVLRKAAVQRDDAGAPLRIQQALDFLMTAPAAERLPTTAPAAERLPTTAPGSFGGSGALGADEGEGEGGGKGEGGAGNPEKGSFAHHKWPSLAEPLEMRGECALLYIARPSISLLY